MIYHGLHAALKCCCVFSADLMQTKWAVDEGDVEM
jgi:hypothetical protein